MPYAKLNASGCEIRKDRIKLRLDCFLDPTEPHYDKHHLYLPNWDSAEAEAGYPGAVDEEGSPTDWEAYQAWVDSLPHIWIDTPFHSHMLHPAHDAPDADIKADIVRCLGYFYAFKQHCWDSELSFIEEWKKVAPQVGEVRHRFVAGKSKDKNKNRNKLQDILSRIAEFDVGIAGASEGIDLRLGKRGTIDVGDSATDRSSAGILYSSGVYHTRVVRYNPANADGSLDTIEVWLEVVQAANSIRFGTFIDNGSNNLTCHDAEEVGEASIGYNEFTGLSIDVSTDDYIGCDSAKNKILSISGQETIGRAVNFVLGQHCVPDDTETYSLGSNHTYSLGGTGTEGGAPTTLELRSSTDTAARLALDTEITLGLRSSTETDARLTISVAIFIAGRAYSNTRADISLGVGVSIALRSYSETRAAIKLTVTEVTELELRSATDTRADLALTTLIALALKSATDTRAALTISVTAVTELYLRCATDTRAGITLNSIIALALRSITDTRASLALSTLIALALRSSTSTRAAIILTVSLITEIECRSASTTRAALQLNSLITLALLCRTNTRATLALTTAMRQQTLNMELHDRQLTMAMRGNQQ